MSRSDKSEKAPALLNEDGLPCLLWKNSDRFARSGVPQPDLSRAESGFHKPPCHSLTGSGIK